MPSVLPASSKPSSDAAPTVDEWVRRINADPGEVEFMADALLADILAVLESRARDRETPTDACRALVSALLLGRLRADGVAGRQTSMAKLYGERLDIADSATWAAELDLDIDEAGLREAAARLAKSPRSLIVQRHGA